MMSWSNPGVAGEAVSITAPNREALLADVSRRFERGEGFSVATLNLDHAVKLAKDPAFAAAYTRHSHVTADGNPIVWLARLAGQRDVALVPGSELVLPITKLAAGQSVPIGFLGSTEESLSAARSVLEALHPGLNVVMTLSPPMGFDPEGPGADSAIKQIEESGARLVLLALGAPKQERFAARAQEKLPAVGFLSIGAGIDFVAGTQTRAPRWVRAIKAEWLWRVVGDPGRLGPRYAACIVHLPRLTLRALRSRSRDAM